MNYLQVLRNIYKPEIGSVWKAPNEIWTNDFAKNKSSKDLHPSIIKRVNKDNTIVQLIPGTTKNYEKGSCVFKTSFQEYDKPSFFLLKLSMPYNIEDLKNLDRGWNGVHSLDENQVEDLKMQIKFCTG